MSLDWAPHLEVVIKGHAMGQLHIFLFHIWDPASLLQIQRHKGGWDFSGSTKMQNLCFNVKYTLEQWPCQKVLTPLKNATSTSVKEQKI